MTERYYERVWDEEYYILDSNVISPEAFDERVEYDGYTAFEDVMSGVEIVRLLNENEQLKQYKQSVNDVLKSWSQKNLTAKQLQVVLAIMEELNVLGDVE